MKIRPKIPIFQNGGLPSTVTWTDPNSNWFTRSGNNGILEGTYNMLKPLYDKWKSSGSQEDYQAYKKAVDALNTNQRYGYAPGHLRYQQGNNQLFKGYGTNAWQNYVRNNYSFINDAIGKNYSQYHVISSKPYSGDNEKQGWKVDNLWAGETDDRTTWGNLLNPNDPNYQNWKQKFSEIGIDYRTNPEWKTGDVLYGFLKEPEQFKNNPPSNDIVTTTEKKGSSVPAQHQEGGYGFDWNKIRESAQKIFNNPGLYSAGRLVGGLIANEHIYDEALKGIKPVLKQTYNTHRQVVGDEATKQGYYRRAAAGQTKAAQPFTSDADRQVAYMNEAKRIGDELRAQGDLADNQEIRRTSDESNQHQWANTQRATEVANVNLESINRANSLKHNLLAQKHAAQWSSIDNFLSELEYRKRQQLAEDQNLEDQLWMLNQPDFQYSKEYQTAYKNYSNILEKHKKADGTYDEYNPEVVEARGKITELLREYRRKQLLDLQEYKRKRNSYLLFGKSGTKIKVTRKKKEDLLYKSGRDTVEHFRKMSKISSDSYNRKTPKIEKLAPHPKGKAWKFQQGGLAPFVVYKPVALGGETSRSISSESSSSKSSKKDGSDTLDMIKELFKAVAGKGLPSDVNSLYVSMQNFLSRAKAFGSELSTDDIASMYLQQMQRLNTIEYLKNKHDDASKSVIEKDAVNEFAVDALGRIVGQKDGEIVFANSIQDALNKEINPLTNGQLLRMRASDPSLAERQDLDEIAANGIGLSKVGEYIKSMLPSIESIESKNEQFVKVKQGIKALESAPEGDYKQTITDKNNLKQANYALNYLKGILPRNMRTVLELNAQRYGMTADSMLANLINSKTEYKHEEEYTPYTGKAAKNADGSAKSEENVKSNPIMQMIQEQGGVPRTWEIITKDSNIKMSVNGTYYSQIPKVTDDVSIDKMLSESGISGILDSRLGITFGDQNISPDQLKDVMYSNSGGVIVTLPCKVVNGHKEVNLGVKKSYEEAIQEVESKGISKNSPEYNKVLGEILKQKGLNNLLDSNGYPDKTKFSQFLVVEAYTTSKIKQLDPSSQYLEKVKNPDEQLEQRLIKALSTDNKKSDYSLDIDYWLWGDDVYRGSVFIPLTNNINASINAWGDQIKIDESRELENKFQNFNKASTAKSSNSNVL